MVMQKRVIGLSESEGYYYAHARNFAKFQKFSPWKALVELQQKHCERCRRNLNVSLHYIVKYLARFWLRVATARLLR